MSKGTTVNDFKQGETIIQTIVESQCWTGQEKQGDKVGATQVRKM